MKIQKLFRFNSTAIVFIFIFAGLAISMNIASAADPDSVGDFVWWDLDADGVQDSGEPGMYGVSIELINAGPDTIANTGDDSSVGTTTSNSFGGYEFSGLVDGTTYFLQFSKPAGLEISTQDADSDDVDSDADPTTGRTAVFTHTSGAAHPNIDVGFYTPITIGDKAWNDLNANGIQDGLEPGLGGVEVELFTEAGASVITATTIFDGSYSFSSVAPGRYYVQFTKSGFTFSPQDKTVDTADSDADPATGETAVFEVSAGEAKDDIDAGFYQPATIGNLVWNDVNGNGLQDGGELGISGVTVTLYDTMDTKITDTTTNASGHYTFTNVVPNTYYLHFAGPTGYLASPKEQGSDTALDSDIDTTTFKTDSFTVVYGEVQMSKDAAFFDPGAIGDFIWRDLDGDGVQDGGEAGIDGVTLQLYRDVAPIGTLDGGDVAIGTAATSASGGVYDFTDLPAGNYLIDITDTGSVLTGLSLTTGTNPQPVVLTAGTDKNDVDFGYQEATATIGDLVWNDANGDGVKDGSESGIAGVTIDLIDDANGNGVDDGETVLDTKTTDGSGAFDFTGLVAGTYLVDVTDTGNVLTNYSLTGGTDPRAVTITAGQDKNDADFGYQQQNATIGDLVWDDLDGDGVQDGGEPGLAGVTIDLIDDANGNGVDDGETVLDTKTTDGSGAFDFTDLAAGKYIVDVTDTSNVLTNYGLTGGTDPLAVTITAGQDKNDADFGYQQQNASIGDFVWNDANNDTNQDGGESGLSGITVDLIDDANGNGVDDGETVLDTKTTNASGGYDFTGLAAGNYIVMVTDTGSKLTGYSSTTGGNETAVTITAGQNYDGADFGYRDNATATIGDLVWNDADGDGNKDGSELGIDGVTIDLYRDVNENGSIDGGDSLINTATTAGGGAYNFTSLVAGKYIVEVTDTSNVLTNYGLTGGTEPKTVTITPGQDYNGADFGYQIQNATIGDFVYNDIDGDGSFNGSDTGIDGVTIKLYRDKAPIGSLNGADVLVGGPITTSGGGAFDFTGLAAGNYIVDVTDTGNVLTGFSVTDGTDPLAVTITASQDYNDADFGYQQQDAKIGDLVWDDTNGDGVKDVGESGISGVTIALIDDANGNGVDDGETVLGTKTTGASGNYDFTGLPKGDYIVKVTDTGSVITGYNNTTGGTETAVTITAGEDYNDADFGYKDSETASIGDFVWEDLDGDGVQDGGEPGIDGITIDLYVDVNNDGTIDGGDTFVSTQTTAGGGAFDFTSLLGGKYIIDLTDTSNILSGFSLTTGMFTFQITLVAGNDYDDADFGFKDPTNGSIGDIVWNDRDGDGVQENGEPGISGIKVEIIKDINGNGVVDGGESVMATKTTNSTGAYNFVSLKGGNYLVRVDATTVASGLTLTGGTSPQNYTLAVGEDYNDADFGYQGDASINGTIWFDEDGSASQDIGESGLSGVVAFIDLNNDNNRDSSEPFATTNASGTFEIDGLPSGAYALRVDKDTILSGYLLSTDATLFINLSQGQTYTSADFGFMEGMEVYLPLIVNNFVSAPDLVVNSVEASSDLIQVVVENQGTASTASGFWVDFYINPDPVPSHENQSWDDVADEGIVWGVTTALLPGETITLTYSTDPSAANEYYSELNSVYSGFIAAGTPIYAQVDSVHLNTSYGGILEIHEIQGGTYNNITGGTAVSSFVEIQHASTNLPDESFVLPNRK